MVRLMLTLTPCVCILSAIAFSKLFELYLKEEDVTNGNAKKSTPGKCDKQNNINPLGLKISDSSFIVNFFYAEHCRANERRDRKSRELG